MTISGRGGSAPKQNDTTLTPLSFVGKFGLFDMDPCAYDGHHTAARMIVLPDDGLKAEWIGRVWLNPPYTDPTPWMKKLRDHGNGVALVLASTDSRWYHELVMPFAAGILFVKSRPKFQKPDGKVVTLVRASMLVAFGRENYLALENSGIPGHLISLKRQSAKADLFESAIHHE